METITCPLCHRGNQDAVITEHGYTGCLCPECQVIYLSPRPTPEETLASYRQDHACVPASMYIAKTCYQTLHNRLTLRLLRRYCPAGALLEIGAGGGFFLEEARAAAFSVAAIEVNPTQAAAMRAKAIPCEEQALSDASFGGQHFEAIYHCDVLSHFSDPLETFRRIHTRLQPGGYHLFETSNFGGVAPAGLRLVNTFQLPDHLFFFSPHSLRLLLEQSGFALVALYRYAETWHLRFAAALRAARRLLAPAGPHRDTAIPAALHLDDPLHRAYFHLLYFARYDLGRLTAREQQPQTLIVVARKV